MNPALFYLALILFFAVTVVVWLRLDSLSDRISVAPDAWERGWLLRQVFAATGTWLLIASLPFLVTPANADPLGGADPFGLGLMALALALLFTSLAYRARLISTRPTRPARQEVPA